MNIEEIDSTNNIIKSTFEFTGILIGPNNDTIHFTDGSFYLKFEN